MVFESEFVRQFLTLDAAARRANITENQLTVNDLRDLCSTLGLPDKGLKHDLIERIVAADVEFEHDGSHSPRRQIKSSGSSSVKTSVTKNKTMPAGPNFMTVTDEAQAGQNRVLGIDGKSHKPQQSPARTSFDVDFTVMPQIPGFPDGQGDSVQMPRAADGFSWAGFSSMLNSKLAPVHKSLNKLGGAVQDLQKNAVHVADFNPVKHKVERIGEVVSSDHSWIDALQAQVDRLQQQLAKLQTSSRSHENRDHFKRIVVFGVPDVSFEERVKCMQDFFNKHFPSTRYTCSMFTKFDGDTKTWEVTNTGFVEFIDSATRDFVFKDMETRKLALKIHGKTLTMRKGISQTADQRNKTFRKAEEKLKKHVGKNNKVAI